MKNRVVGGLFVNVSRPSLVSAKLDDIGFMGANWETCGEKFHTNAGANCS